ncbi:MAG: enoyl-CoA hydratase/isomerase family protein [Candidatus Rokubacteria bacterium]|nr:enoyl-CoA hydratase/isomerase family protein [Candidatus Rokubacteria bacterium]
MGKTGAGLYRIEWLDQTAEISLTCGKANALNPGSLAAISEALDEAERARARGVILTGYDRFFSAGLDLVTLYEFDRLRLDAFVREFDRVMLRVFAFPRPMVAAVNGHAVAGGCILALACDAQLMPDYDIQIGLNEIRLGLPFPASALEIARHGLSMEFADSILYGGQLYTPLEAMSRGLVDGLTSGDVMEESRAVCRRLAEQPPRAFEAIKSSLKAPAMRRAQENLDELRRGFVEAWFSPEARRLIGEVRARLTKS